MLDGFFAFVVLDTRNNTFYAARDPLGVTCMYIGWGRDGSVWLSSEMKCLKVGRGMCRQWLWGAWAGGEDGLRGYGYICGGIPVRVNAWGPHLYAQACHGRARGSWAHGQSYVFMRMLAVAVREFTPRFWGAYGRPYRHTKALSPCCGGAVVTLHPKGLGG